MVAKLKRSTPDCPAHVEHWRLRMPETYLSDLRDWPKPSGPSAEIVPFRPKPRRGWQGWRPGGGNAA